MTTPDNPTAIDHPTVTDQLTATWSDEDGSLVSEYGLIAVLGATITGVAISWAKGGAIATLLNVILRQVRALVGV